MKKSIILYVFFGFVFSAYSQNKVLYGFASKGGSKKNGVLFAYNLGSKTYTIKKHFSAPSDGLVPRASLIKASNGKLYGTTFAGGAKKAGTIFQYDPDSEKTTMKVSFSGANGSLLSGSLIMAKNGKLYGMASKGGISENGTLYEYDPESNSLAVKVRFTGDNGSSPQGGLMQASNGKLYGMTNMSDLVSGNNGVLFSYDPNTSVYTKLITFDGSAKGGRPYGDLIEISGKLYGMTSIGGVNNLGIIFEFDPATEILTKKFDFNGNLGKNPTGTLLKANNGKCYGMASGGTSNNGLIFEYDPVTNAYAVKANFDFTNGSNPEGSLMQASDGKLYGLSSYGGSEELGTMFSFDLATNTITKLLDFDGTNGSTPYYTRLLEVESKSLAVADPAKSQVKIYPNPVTDILYLQGISKAKMLVHNTTGQELINKNISNGQLDVRSLSKGVYLVTIETETGASTHKVVKE